ncbi:MAG: GntR family transcriptional regulator, partial [Actinomycetota bacterium]|nr:GntR family transcriptional regulator [Actinomycetota bacterium]
MGHEDRERAWAEIEHRIVVGDLPGGAPLDEAALAEELSADRTGVREALTRLERDGFVQSDGADAFAVCVLDEAELREAYPIALLLEGLAVRSTDYQDGVVARLRGRNAEMAASAADPSAAAHLDYAFHDELVAHCDNDQLLATLRPLKRILLRYEHRYMATAEAVHRSAAQHELVIDAIERGDLDGAARAIESNFRQSLSD